MTKIEWTERTWNPIVGCSIVSPGCTNCYAMRMAARIEKMQPDLMHYRGLTKPSAAGPVWTGHMGFDSRSNGALTEPLRRSKPTMWFVNSMGDLFHEDVPDEWIDRVTAVMALCPQHTFQVLTKRSERMREYVSRLADPGEQMAWRVTLSNLLRDLDRADDASGPGPAWPLPNVWLGVSAERQQEADERIPDLLATPSAVRFVSAEPLLGPIDISHLWANACAACSNDGVPHLCTAGTQRLDWVIVGGESGRGARPMHPDWAREIRDQCQAAGVPFFFKQWGHWGAPLPIAAGQPLDDEVEVACTSDGDVLTGLRQHHEDVTVLRPVGKQHSANRLLDGREWNEMPAREAAPA